MTADNEADQFWLALGATIVIVVVIAHFYVGDFQETLALTSK